MNSFFYLFLPKRGDALLELNTATLNWIYSSENGELIEASGLLSDAVVAAENCIVTAVLSGEDVLSLKAEVPGKNSQRIQQAIPYVLEDNVVDDVEDLYFAIKKKNNDSLNNEYDIAIIDKIYFENIILQLKDLGIQADRMIADYSLLEDCLIFDDERMILHSENMRFSTSVNNIDVLDEDGFINNKNIQLIYCGNNSNASNPVSIWLQHLSLHADYKSLSFRLCLIKNSSNNSVINLLQGEHKKKKDWSHTSKIWLPVTILFGIWLSMQSIMFIFEYVDLKNKNKQLNTEIINIYKKTFPQSRRIIDAQAQMKQKLISLRKRKGQSGRGFSEMLANSASAFSKEKHLVIKSLRYYDGRMNLEIQISSLQALDRLKKQLKNENGYEVEIQNASSGKDTVTARIQIVGVQ